MGFILAFWFIKTTPTAAIQYVDATPTFIQKPYCDPLLAPGQADDECFYKAPKTKAKTSPYACNCVLWAQAHGMPLRGYGAAKDYPINSMVPAARGFVVTYEGPDGHMAEYIRVGGNLILDEANFSYCTVTSGRVLPVTSPLIKGYIN